MVEDGRKVKVKGKRKKSRPLRMYLKPKHTNLYNLQAYVMRRMHILFSYFSTRNAIRLVWLSKIINILDIRIKDIQEPGIKSCLNQRCQTFCIIATIAV